jgi:lipoprotein-anchoring transpeptidase ErfK/SrfK
MSSSGRPPRRFDAMISLGLVLFAAACAPVPRPSARPAVAVTAPPPKASVPQAPPGPVMTPAEIDAEIALLRAIFGREVPQAILLPPERQRNWIRRAKAAVATAGMTIDYPQLLVVVDCNPAVQELAIMLAQPQGPWAVIGSSKVSTGQAGRRGYYITPTGIFLHTDAILDWRAEGTFNENHIRGLGLKGMRVWDFGWVEARPGWLTDSETGEIRLLLHATDPNILEARIGRPASKGCVRVPATVNRFLDRHGVLDADYERAAADDIRFRALLRSDRAPTPLAGRALVIIDSGEADR